MRADPADNLSLEEMDKLSLLHPYTHLVQHAERGPLIMTEGAGVRLTDNHGRRYIDAMGGLWCVNVGYGRPEIVEAIAAQATKLPYYHIFASMGTEPAIRLADRVLRLVPENMSKVFFGNSGSDANDTNVKLIWYYNNLLKRPKKKKIIARRRGYHGVTVAAASMTGLPHVHAAFDLPLPGFLHTSAPHHYWEAPAGMSEREFAAQLASDLDVLIRSEGPETVAAFIAEPVMGAGGVVVPPEGYYPLVQEVLRKHDVLFIADEVICGFGRLGTWFGCDYFGIEPDLMTIAKGLTSGYLPMSASVISEPIWDVVRDGSKELGVFGHGYTYSAHPTAAAAGLANLDIMENEGLVPQAAEAGAYMQRRLREVLADHPLVGEVRGVGLIAGVELVADKRNKIAFEPALKVGQRASDYALAGGVISRPLGNTLAFSPPLVITHADIDEMTSIVWDALERVRSELITEGCWKAA
ncbi:MAG: hypothetical protein CMM50_17240 [Rhodospirillaceae bacterium]|nr:hypothetical protein [Rhodospirillaceae bacterium]